MERDILSRFLQINTLLKRLGHWTDDIIISIYITKLILRACQGMYSIRNLAYSLEIVINLKEKKHISHSSDATIQAGGYSG